MKKNNLLPILILGLLFWLQISQTSCVNDKLPEEMVNPVCDSLIVTYDNQVKAIIDASCAIGGCHAQNAVIGDYTNYSKMNSILNDEKFKKRVLEVKDMPEGDMLTEEELLIMECWIANNYAEN